MKNFSIDPPIKNTLACDLNKSPYKRMLVLLSLQTALTLPSLITLETP